MLQGDEKLRADLIALNDNSGGLLRWDALKSVVDSSRIEGSTRKDLNKSAAGEKLLGLAQLLHEIEKLLGRIEKALARHAEKRSAVFLAHSFHEHDAQLVRALRRELEAKALRIVTGQKPAPRSVSAKVLDRIDSARVFIALFTASPRTGRPSAWVVSELGYAARNPRVVLLEEPLDEREIGGIQGDVEYIRFTRKAFKSAFKRAAKSASGSGS